MRRRDFCKATALAVAAIQTKAFAAANDTPLRVALIGSGWYGKTDLFHLIQVAPIDVVGLCDVDSKMVKPLRSESKSSMKTFFDLSTSPKQTSTMPGSTMTKSGASPIAPAAL